LSSYIVIILVSIAIFGGLLVTHNLDDFSVEGSDIIVAKAGGNYTSIQAAIDNASVGDTIYVWAGIYYENVLVNKTLTIIGNGTTNTFINGSRSGDVVNITADWVNITGLTVTYSGNRTWPLTDAGIEIFYANNVHVYDVNCSDNHIGLLLNQSDQNIIEDNIIIRTESVGLFLLYSENNIMKNNLCRWNNYGIFLSIGCNNNVLLKNKCNSNYLTGITMFLSRKNELYNNTCNSNGWNGVSLLDSDANTIINGTYKNNDNGVSLSNSFVNVIDNNTIDQNGNYGMYVDSSMENRITYNSCQNNVYGIWFIESDRNIIYCNSIDSNNKRGIEMFISDANYMKNNTLNSNGNSGMYMEVSSSNIIFKNSINSNNNEGLYMSASRDNYIDNNNFTGNRVGLTVEAGSNSNTFENNMVTLNTQTGFFIGAGVSQNRAYHNHFISNTQQAIDLGNNAWSINNEGNYWSDYTGLDNGDASRVKGDGIGDTQLPHSGLDHYPFVQSYGWLRPGVPNLVPSINISTDGSYTILWNTVVRSNRYILEEDTISNFSSALEIYNGSGSIVNFANKQNNSYYYRARAFNDDYEGLWSEPVSVLVDWPPNTPTGLRVINPTAHEVTLLWNTSPDADLKGYYIMVNDTGNGSVGPFHVVRSISSLATQDTISNLAEKTEYHFALIAFDKNDLNSSYSNVVSVTTKDITSPAAPSEFTATAISDIEIRLNWSLNTESDVAGYIIYMNDTGKDHTGTFHNISMLNANINSYLVSGLMEQTTYYFKILAFDDVWNNSTLSEIALATTLDLTPPSAPTDLKVLLSTNNSLTFSWSPSVDKDVIGYLVFKGLSSDQESENFTQLNLELITETTFKDTGLTEDTEYYYAVRSVDDVDWKSEYSEVLVGKTRLDQHPPEINNSLRDFKITEDTYDNTSIDLYVWFKDPNHDTLNFKSKGQEYITVTIFQNNGTVILEPEHNWNGEETLTFSASDGDKEVNAQVTITVTPVNDPPLQPQIVSFDDGIVLEYGEFLDLEGECQDPDSPYGETLTYVWTSSIDKKLGSGQLLEEIILTHGEHVITMEVFDKAGESVTTSANVTVLEKPESEKSEWDPTIAYGIIGIVIVIVIIIGLIIFMKKRKKPTEEKEADEEKPKPEPDATEKPQVPQPQVTLPIPQPQPGLPFMPFPFPPPIPLVQPPQPTGPQLEPKLPEQYQKPEEAQDTKEPEATPQPQESQTEQEKQPIQSDPEESSEAQTSEPDQEPETKIPVEDESEQE
jgi:parallel beta-helix repeat protein